MKEVKNPLFWVLYPEDRARLMMFVWDNFHEKLDIPTDPYKQPPVINAPDYEEDRIEEINREMSLPAHSHKLRKEEK